MSWNWRVNAQYAHAMCVRKRSDRNKQTRAKSINSIDSIWHRGFVQSNGRLLCAFTSCLCCRWWWCCYGCSSYYLYSDQLPNCKFQIEIEIQNLNSFTMKWFDPPSRCKVNSKWFVHACVQSCLRLSVSEITLKSWNKHTKNICCCFECMSHAISSCFIRWTRFISWYYWRALTRIYDFDCFTFGSLAAS